MLPSYVDIYKINWNDIKNSKNIHLFIDYKKLNKNSAKKIIKRLLKLKKKTAKRKICLKFSDKTIKEINFDISNNLHKDFIMSTTSNFYVCVFFFLAFIIFKIT